MHRICNRIEVNVYALYTATFNLLFSCRRSFRSKGVWYHAGTCMIDGTVPVGIRPAVHACMRARARIDLYNNNLEFV